MSHITTSLSSTLLLLCSLLGPAPTARAQEETPPAAAPVQDPALDPKAVQARLDEIEKNESLDEDTKKAALDSLRSALADLAKAAEHDKRTEAYKRSIGEAPAAAQKIRAELERAPEQPEVRIPEGASAEAAKLEREKEQSTLLSAQSELRKLGDAVGVLEARAKIARDEQTKATADLAATETDLQAAPVEGTPELLTETRRIKLVARQHALRRQLDSLEQDLLSIPMRLQLATAERDRAQRRVEQQTALVAAYDEVVSRLQLAEAAAAKRRAEQERTAAADQHPIVREVAQKNATMTDQLAAAVAEQTPAKELLDRTSAQLEQVKDTYERTKTQLERGGLRGLSGSLMRKQRGQMAQLLADLAKGEARWRGRSTEAQAREFELYLEQRELADLDAATETVLDRADDLTAEQRETARREVKKLLETRVDLVKKLDKALGDLLGNLHDLDRTRTSLATEVEGFASLLDEWLLWMPNTTAPGEDALAQLAFGAQWLVSPARWTNAANLAVAQVEESWALAALAALALVLLVAVRRRARARLERIAGQIRRISRDRLALTWQALGLVIVLTAPLPFLVGAIGWAVQSSGGARPIGAGLWSAAVVGFGLGLLMRLCAPRGVGEAHFGWRPAATAALHRNVRWVRWPLVAAVFLTVSTNAQPNEDLQNGLGRLAFVVGVLAVVVFWQRILRPRGDVMEPILARHPGGWLARLKWVWYPAALAIPLAFAALALSGYYFTARELERCLTGTILLFLGVLLLRAIAVRWLLIEQRRMAVEQFQKQRESGGGSASVAGEEGEVTIPDDVPVDLSAVNEQTKKLVQTASVIAFLVGVWAIWYDVLPALAILDSVDLWTHQVTRPDGSVVPEWTTLQDVGLAIVALILTGTAARNLPGVLQVAVLKNLPLEASTRYAIVTVSRYVLTIIGLVVAFNIVGFSWSSVQWLVAALGVGIGFGLQEIIANFVCGLILLFERPVRIGDSVTIGDTSGVVSRIRIRATTITDWDRKEMVIPNKELITGRVLNWTLSNNLNRVVINVGTAYGTDTEKVRRLLVEAARSHPKVLADPAPLATFDGFGDSTLNFVLRVYLADYDGRLNTISELHTAVDEAFKAAGIEIAFPQLDLHLRSAEAAVRVEPERTAVIHPAAPKADPKVARPSGARAPADRSKSRG